MPDKERGRSQPFFMQSSAIRQGPNSYELFDLGRLGAECCHSIAREYAEATRALIEAALNKGMVDIMGHPVQFLMRHTVELFLKAIVPDAKNPGGSGHALNGYIEALVRIAEVVIPDEAKDLIERLKEFSAIDPKSMTFRFADGSRKSFGGVDASSLPDFRLVVDFEELPHKAKHLFDLLEALSYHTRTNCNCFLCSEPQRVDL